MRYISFIVITYIFYKDYHTRGVHSGSPSPPAGLLFVEGPRDRGGCQSGGLTLI